MRRDAALWVLSVSLPGLVAWPGSATAADDELILAVAPGYGLLFGDGPRHGAGGTVSGWLGLTDTLWLSLSGSAFAFADGHPEPAGGVWEVMGGLVTALDVFRWVPYFEGQVGVVGRGDTLVPTARFGLGVDYLLSPSWFVGLVGRVRPLSEPLGTLKTTVSFRAGLRFEL